jgi:subtilisin-like proprotein convertase family protein
VSLLEVGKLESWKVGELGSGGVGEGCKSEIPNPKSQTNSNDPNSKYEYESFARFACVIENKVGELESWRVGEWGRKSNFVIGKSLSFIRCAHVIVRSWKVGELESWEVGEWGSWGAETR